MLERVWIKRKLFALSVGMQVDTATEETITEKTHVP